MLEVNSSLAALSDQLVLVAVLCYVTAMLGYALELGFGRAAPAPATEPARVPVTVGGGGGSGGEGADAEGGRAAARPTGPGWASRAGVAAVVLSWLGWAANLGALVTRGLSVGRWPWANMYEFVVAIALAAVTVFLVMQLRYRVRFLGAFIMVAATLALGLSVRYFHVQAGPVVPALNSYWVAIHVSAAIVAFGLFTMGAVASVLYFVRKEGATRLPDRKELERLTHRLVVIAFPVWTFAIIAGALWADKAWGRYWAWDPKEVWSFITWIAYAAYLHARATAGWRGRTALIVQLVAFGCLLFNLFGVNIFLGGLHSYADIPG
ncbi:cytochrome c biogenesis protein CcsA [Thermostaphylospora chromogena]|uniref:Cytochrome c-type biogenesis protein CcsB n=1 Tax=Thermostaphylospora chromogena TaxID=35622 RepID=A0A1H1DHH8_9ACTN|nr:cytochrome c biogenesis protein CcsA [Thermostaphylospora chromogena]SDQ75820.1 cytochrome c-type biogenesis protein CcsB [Thermostaphylospora chromogena]